MKSFKQYIRERSDVSFVHEGSILIRIRDFIDALEDQHPDKERLLEIRENVPDPGTYAVRLLSQVPG